MKITPDCEWMIFFDVNDKKGRCKGGKCAHLPRLSERDGARTASESSCYVRAEGRPLTCGTTSRSIKTHVNIHSIGWWRRAGGRGGWEGREGKKRGGGEAGGEEELSGEHLRRRLLKSCLKISKTSLNEECLKHLCKRTFVERKKESAQPGHQTPVREPERRPGGAGSPLSGAPSTGSLGR